MARPRPGQIERRIGTAADTTPRAKTLAATGAMTLTGYAAVYNSLSQDLGGFKERIIPGAFTRALREKPDVIAQFNHEGNQILGRTSSGTLSLRDDGKGLLYSVALADTEYHRHIYKLVQRGDIYQSSFMFRMVKEQWRTENGQDVRELLDVELFDVAPVTRPAYLGATVQANGAPAFDDLRMPGSGFDPAPGGSRFNSDGLTINVPVTITMPGTTASSRDADVDEARAVSLWEHHLALWRRLHRSGCTKPGEREPAPPTGLSERGKDLLREAKCRLYAVDSDADRTRRIRLALAGL